MARSSGIALFFLVALLSRTSSGFTISLAPLLTARLGLGLWGSSYVNNFSAQSPPASNSHVKSSEAKTRAVPIVRPAVENFKFEYDDVRMLSDCKSECMELIYAKSMDRGFPSL